MRERLSFRASEKAIANMETYMREHKIKTRSQAVTEMLENFVFDRKTEGATGDIISCPMRRIPLYLESGFSVGVHPMTPVDTSVCKTCPENPCETWKNIESERRIQARAR